MIARTHRFHGHNSLRAVYQGGQTVRAGQLSLKYLKRPTGRRYRLAVVVSRKVSKSAVVRNRIRRRLYEIVRRHETELNGSYDLVMTVFAEQLAKMDHANLEALASSLLNKAHVLND